VNFHSLRQETAFTPLPRPETALAWAGKGHIWTPTDSPARIKL
jgi:hypothetical protein